MTLYGKKTVIDTVDRVFRRNTQGITKLEGKLLTEAAEDAAKSASLS